MNNSFDLLLLAILSPLALAVAIAIGLPKRIATKVAYGVFALPVFIGLYLWAKFSDPGTGFYEGFAFYKSYDTGLGSLGLHLSLGLNGISLPLFVLAAIVGLSAGLYALQSNAERLKTYLALLLVMQSGLLGVFASIDLFFFYFFHELALIPTFIMVGIWGGRDRSYAAMKVTIYLTLGAMLSLIGLIALYHQIPEARTFDLITLRKAVAAAPIPLLTQKYLFGILMFGFGILVSLWPLHTWAPLGYGAAPSSAAMLHAGVLKKFGLYGLIQIALPLLPAGASQWSHILSWLALGNVVIIGLVTIAQRDLKQMIGYSSVMHMGYAFLGIATVSTVGVAGVVLMMVAHGLSVALLFLLATSVHHRTQTFDMAAMGGLAQRTPVLAAFFVAATMASIGLPGFANFWGELSIFVALWTYSKLYTVLAVTGVVISAVYGLRSVARVFFGPASEEFTKVAEAHPPADLRWAERLPALVLLAALLAVGFWPKSIGTGLNDSVKSIYPQAFKSAAPTVVSK